MDGYVCVPQNSRETSGGDGVRSWKRALVLKLGKRSRELGLDGLCYMLEYTSWA